MVGCFVLFGCFVCLFLGLFVVLFVCLVGWLGVREGGIKTEKHNEVLFVGLFVAWLGVCLFV